MYRPLYDSTIEKGGEVTLNTAVAELIIEDGKALGVETPVGELVVPSLVVPTESVTAPVVVCAVAIWDMFNVLPKSTLPHWYVDQIEGIMWRWGASNPIVCAMRRERRSHERAKWVPWNETRSRLNIWGHALPGYGGDTGEVQVVFWFIGDYLDYPTNTAEARNPEVRRQLKGLFSMCEEDLSTFFPGWREHLVWETFHWGLFGLAAMPGLRGSQPAPRMEVPGVKNLYLVGESVREASGITIQAKPRIAQICADHIIGTK